MAFYRILLHLHSGLRWFVLLFLLISIVVSLFGWKQQKAFTAGKNKVFLSTLTLTHLQLVIGLILYFISPKVIFTTNSFSDDMLRFFLVEHIALMAIAIVLITVGYVRTKKISTDVKKYRNIFGFFLLTLLLILMGIPWPWQDLGASWG